MRLLKTLLSLNRAITLGVGKKKKIRRRKKSKNKKIRKKNLPKSLQRNFTPESMTKQRKTLKNLSPKRVMTKKNNQRR